MLYVASTVDNAIFAVSKASQRNDDGGTGQVIYRDQTHLHGALGMAAAPNGHLLVSNNDAINGDPNQPSEIVEFTLSGRFVKQLSMDPAQGGSFGLNVQTTGLTLPVRRRGRQSIHSQHLDVAHPLNTCKTAGVGRSSLLSE